MRLSNIWREDNNGSKAWEGRVSQGYILQNTIKHSVSVVPNLYSPIFPMIISVYQGRLFNKIEILTGKSMKPSGDADKIYSLEIV
jgi:hypothetical protein